MKSSKKNNNIKRNIENATTIEDAVRLGEDYYASIPVNVRAQIFNQVIFQRKIDTEDVYFPLKLAINLSFLFILCPEKKTLFINNNKRRNMNSEIQVFRHFVEKIISMYIEQQTDQVKGNEDHVSFTYLNYQFHYPSISLGDYMEMFKLLDQVSNRVYGFSIYKIIKILIIFTSDVSVNEKKRVFRLPNEWISIERMNKYFDNKLSSNILLSLFINESELDNKMIYPTDIFNEFQGKIGVKTKKGYFVPQSYFILENVFRYLLENEESNKPKGRILEKHVKDILNDFFGEKNVFKTFYDELRNEQDILVKYKNYYLSIECKAQNFKDVRRDQNQANKRLSRKFNSVILAGCKQCERVKERFDNNNSVIYYDSDNSKKREIIVNVPDTKKVEVLKIVVTLDDYLNLSESPYDFLDSKYMDTWVVNLFNLKRILWASTPDHFIKYVKYRTSGLKTIRSINSDELEQFGYFVSPNFNMYPQNNLGITISLQQGFSRIFDEYNDYSTQKEMDAWEDHFQNNNKEKGQY